MTSDRYCHAQLGIWNLKARWPEIWSLESVIYNLMTWWPLPCQSEIWNLITCLPQSWSIWKLKSENWSLESEICNLDDLRPLIWSLESGIWNLMTWWPLSCQSEIWNLIVCILASATIVVNLETEIWKLKFGIWNLKSRWRETVDMVSGIWNLKFDDLVTVAMSIWNLKSDYLPATIVVNLETEIWKLKTDH